jgi:hypothetical protein
VQYWLHKLSGSFSVTFVFSAQPELLMHLLKQLGLQSTVVQQIHFVWAVCNGQSSAILLVPGVKVPHLYAHICVPETSLQPLSTDVSLSHAPPA